MQHPTSKLPPRPRNSTSRSGSRGFTLLEVLIIVVIMGIVAAIAVPALMSVIRRSRIEGVAQSMMRMLLEARAEAIYRGSPVIVHPDIRLDGGGNEQHYLVAWVDVDENGKFDGDISGDGTYQASTLSPARTVDYPLYEWPLPYLGADKTAKSFYFWGAADADPTLGTDVMDGPSGLTTKPDGVIDDTMVEGDGYGDWEAAIVFLANGSVTEAGGIRFAIGPFGGGDQKVNFLELRIEPRASGRAVLRKYIPAPVGSYQPKGYDEEASDQNGYAYEWEWY